MKKSDIPQYVRRCFDAARQANHKNREAATERLQFYAGGEGQWRSEEITKRRGQQRPFLTVNKCKPAVDQIEGDIRLNPPGPQVHPVGEGADGDTADIIEGLIRETEYRSGAKTAYSTAGKYVAASGEAYLELVTEYTNDRSYAQQLRICSVEDPSTIFFDPNSRMANRQDAMWAGKLRVYSREEYKATFGDKHRVLEPRAFQAASGWIADVMGISSDWAMVNEWTGGIKGEGPYYVCEFYMVEMERKKLTLYDNNIAYFEDEDVPASATPKPGDEYTRIVPRRTITKYVVDAFEVLDETEWIGRLIPIFPVLGPEVYIKGELHRLSLIAGAIDAQRALNFVTTAMVEVAGDMPRAPWIGPQGTFDDPRWQNANTEKWAYLEYKPVLIPDEINGTSHLAPPPQRNLWEAAIQWLLQLKMVLSDDIKAVTAIYDPSLGANKGDQSGKAIEQLRSESNVGNYSYADNLHRAIEVMYGEMVYIFPKILDGQRVVTIVRPDSQHELMTINKEFPGGVVPEVNGKKEKANNISLGQYSVRVTVGPDFDTRQKEAVPQIIEFSKVAPETFAEKAVAARVLRMIGDGNPKVEQIADIMDPTSARGGEAQLGAQLQQLTVQNQQLTKMVQLLAQEKAAKLPEIEAKKWQAALDSWTKINVAKINASKDLDRADADREADLLKTIMGMGHEAGSQAEQHEHEATQAELAAQAAKEQASQQERVQ